MSKSGNYEPFSKFAEMLYPLYVSHVKGFLALLLIFKRKYSLKDVLTIANQEHKRSNNCHKCEIFEEL